MLRGALFCLLALLSLVSYLLIPKEVQAAGAATFALVSGIGLLLWDAAGAIRRRRKIGANPLDPVLRSLVASELSWENASLQPALSEPALAFLGFLVTEWGFSRATVSPDGRRFSFRKGAFEIVAHPGGGTEAGFSARLYHSDHGSRVLAERRYLAGVTPGLTVGSESASAYLRRHLEEVEADLRR